MLRSQEGEGFGEGKKEGEKDLQEVLRTDFQKSHCPHHKSMLNVSFCDDSGVPGQSESGCSFLRT